MRPKVVKQFKNRTREMRMSSVKTSRRRRVQKTKPLKRIRKKRRKKNNEVMHSIFPPNSMNTLVFVHAISRFLNWNSCNMMLIMQNEQNQAKWMNNTRWPKQNTEIHAKFSQKRISSRTKGKL